MRSATETLCWRWSAQFRAVGAKPLASFAIPGTRGGNQPPVGARVIEPLEVHQLVNEHVVSHPLGHSDETPVQADVATLRAGSPPRPLIPNTDTRDRQAVQIGQLAQPIREVRACLRAEPLSIVDGQATVRQQRALPQHPVDVALRKRVRLSTRPAARNGHPDAAVEFDTEQVSPRAAVAHEVDRCDRADGGC